MSRHCLSLCAAFVLLGACAESDPPVLGDSGPPAMLDSGTGVVDDTKCTAEMNGQVRDCQCADGLSGTQRCLNEAWAECFCTGNVTPMDAGSGSGDLCKAGYYTGTFQGEYWSGVFADPLSGMSWVSVDVQAGGSSDTPGLGLTLDEQVMDLGEFQVRTVKDGCVVGIADAFGLPNPFVGVLTGELNCNTGLFEGTLTGYYDLLTTGLTFPFEGPVSARFADDALVDGKWLVEENQNSASPPGGNGTWNVTRTGEVTDAPPLPPECTEILGSMPDAGTGTTDAGTGTGDAGVGDGG